MNETFKIISEYLDRTGEEVEGRAREEMSEEVAETLKAFAAGTLAPDTRAEVANLLKQHPGWVTALAGEATRRIDAGGKLVVPGRIDGHSGRDRHL